jgi:hypothetical protein
MVVYTISTRKDIKPDELKSLAIDILDYLSVCEENGQGRKIYVNNEFDSNRTTFEELSNRRLIGVLSSKKTVANVLLVFLRIIIDNYPDLLIFNIDDGENPPQMEMSDIVKCLSKNQDFHTSKSKRKSIKVWDLQSIKQYLTDNEILNAKQTRPDMIYKSKTLVHQR